MQAAVTPIHASSSSSREFEVTAGVIGYLQLEVQLDDLYE